jgi:cell division protein FtsB
VSSVWPLWDIEVKSIPFMIAQQQTEVERLKAENEALRVLNEELSERLEALRKASAEQGYPYQRITLTPPRSLFRN